VVLAAVLLVVADRAAAAYAGDRAARQMQSQGLPARPHVTIEGFPFLTQVASRNLRDVHITASDLREGAVTASLIADATDVRLNPGYRSGVVTRAEGTVLISFSSVAAIARDAGVPGVTASADGPDRIRFRVNLGVFTTDVIASIAQTGPRTFRFRIVSASGLPASVLGPLADLTFQAPVLPYGITIQGVRVTSAGVAGHLSAHDIHFSR
jgi:hypothetical protein